VPWRGAQHSGGPAERQGADASRAKTTLAWRSDRLLCRPAFRRDRRRAGGLGRRHWLRLRRAGTRSTENAPPRPAAAVKSGGLFGCGPGRTGCADARLNVSMPMTETSTRLDVLPGLCWRRRPPGSAQAGSYHAGRQKKTNRVMVLDTSARARRQHGSPRPAPESARLILQQPPAAARIFC